MVLAIVRMGIFITVFLINANNVIACVNLVMEIRPRVLHVKIMQHWISTVVHAIQALIGIQISKYAVNVMIRVYLVQASLDNAQVAGKIQF